MNIKEEVLMAIEETLAEIITIVDYDISDYHKVVLIKNVIEGENDGH